MDRKYIKTSETMQVLEVSFVCMGHFLCFLQYTHTAGIELSLHYSKMSSKSGMFIFLCIFVFPSFVYDLFEKKSYICDSFYGCTFQVPTFNRQ